MTHTIGLILPCDMTLDREYWSFVPHDVSVLITRTGFHDGPLGIELGLGVSDFDEIAYATRSLSKVDPDVVAFACTSGSYLRGLEGERQMCQIMLQAGAKKAMTTSGAVLEALRELGVSRVAVGTPYPEAMGAVLGTFLRDAGYEPVSVVNLELAEVVHGVPGSEVWRLAKAAMRPDAQAIFLACTGVPTLDLLQPMEQHFGIPVLSANQVTMWATLRAAGATSIITDQALFRVDLKPAAKS